MIAQNIVIIDVELLDQPVNRSEMCLNVLDILIWIRCYQTHSVSAVQDAVPVPNGRA